ncbi:MAG: multidrug transporter AcrB [endosymbiont of Galathealinum brachiosum]|uniref:Multidrug transporter AcrB n=1 Tax=endosymbiont of Galathealinum brachiosum TaxID=2200906 RepID=A0A370DI95_9GAMM|nr:MAG: multidrug transporter AcrB [endosymbiont of Galathealinum brachiosum]
MNNNLGISGKVAQYFLNTEITPLLALLGFLLGIFAVMITPREEEPQINVTFANVFIAFPGASASDVEQLISVPAEQVLSEIEGIKHIYSVSRPGMSVLTVQFKVGEDRTQAIVRLYNTVYSNQDWLPQGLGVAQPIIKPKGIDDVPIVAMTLWTKDESHGRYELTKVAHAIEAELKRVPGTRDIYTKGAANDVVQILLDATTLAAYKLSVSDLENALRASNSSDRSGQLISDNNQVEVQSGQFLSSVSEVKDLVVGMHNDKPIYLRDVAQVKRGAVHPEQTSWFGVGAGSDLNQKNIHGEYPAVTLAIAKQPGTNAVEIANQVIERVEQLKGVFIPDNVEVTITRNYGLTADAKSKQLIGKLAFATTFVVLLVLFALGWREAIIVGLAVVITLAITLFASWAWGFTLNRVSLFALIFSIGILVDDAIVVVENIHRHMQLGGKSFKESIPLAVDEVGGPTILATFTVIAALLPMAFVTGMMGPYMSPIPINASLGMLISLVVAFVVTPWLAYKVLAGQSHSQSEVENEEDSKLYVFFNKYLAPFLSGEKGQSNRRKLFIGILALLISSVALVGFKQVVLKMLPFDNKSEFQVIVDMPEGTTLEKTTRVLGELGRVIAKVPEVSNYQVYAGDAAPINFNGLVRQYYLRQQANEGDIQVNLLDKSERDKKSHEIARDLRDPLQLIGKKYNANIKIVEVPPGPPVMSPLVAEIYGLNYSGQHKVAKDIRKVFDNTADVVDVDDTIEAEADKIIIHVDQQKAAMAGVTQQQIVSLISTVVKGQDVSYLHTGNMKYPLPLRLQFKVEDRARVDSLLSLRVHNRDGKLIPLSEMVRIENTKIEYAIYHKDLLPVVMVTGDTSGDLDSPLYGMFDIMAKLTKDKPLLQQHMIDQPENPYQYSMKWDGEWQITYETFRDMGIAYSVGLILIYFLVVAQFRSYLVPLIIMAPIPLTIIGVMPGHALLGAQFTATSMIGMIALAGIIVRNSILLVDFINQQVEQGMAFEKAVINAGAVRAKPIVLTGLAAMLGAFFILDDPIFSGLAISLIFGILVSTLLTLVVIPVMYYALMRNRV